MKTWLIRLVVVAVATGAFALDPPLAQYRVTSPAGYRQSPLGGVSGGETLHEGVDLFGPLGADILAAAPGVVTEVWLPPDGYFRGHPVFGGMVVIDHESGIWTRYAHLRSVSVTEGQRVAKGEVIGRQGNTGRSDGEHLHFAVVVDPLVFFPAPIGLSDVERKALLR